MEWPVLSAALGNYLEYKFYTAEDPPIAWLEKVSGDYPKLEFLLAYGDTGFGFAALAEAKNGKVTINEETNGDKRMA